MIFLLMLPVMAHAQENGWKHQMRFGWGGYPVMENVIHTWSWCDCGAHELSLGDIYSDYEKPMYTTGAISAESAWLYKDWFTFAVTLSGSFTWQSYADAITDARTGADTSLFVHIMPQARFNWLRREYVRMYSSIGLGVLTGYDLEKDFGILPSGQLVPVGIEAGRKVFGFCELGIGFMYTGVNAGIGFRF